MLGSSSPVMVTVLAACAPALEAVVVRASAPSSVTGRPSSVRPGSSVAPAAETPSTEVKPIGGVTTDASPVAAGASAAVSMLGSVDPTGTDPPR